MNAQNENTTPPRTGMRRIIPRFEYRHLRGFGVVAYCLCRCPGRRGPHVPLVQRLRLGSLLPGPCGAESRGRLLVPHYPSPRICPT